MYHHLSLPKSIADPLAQIHISNDIKGGFDESKEEVKEKIAFRIQTNLHGQLESRSPV
jgi:hypothetical protein